LNPVRYLRDRGLPAAIVALGIAALLVSALRWWLAPPPKADDFVGPPRSGYTLTNFTMHTFDVDGLPSMTVTAPHLERRENDDALYINAPVYELASNQPGVPDWKGNSQYGWVNAAGTVIKLQGAVYMHRDAYTLGGTETGEAELRTTEVTAWPKENRMETAAPAQMRQGESRMYGVGMRANLNTNHLELLNDVHGTFPPRQRKAKAPAQPAARRAGPGPARAAAGAGQAG
jgi:lipopolysaccharide export system protein LptC